MAQIESFVNRTLPDVLGCPLPLVEQAVIDSIKDFMDKTWAVSEGFSVITATVDSYEVATLDLSSAVPTNHKIQAIKSFQFEGVPRELIEHDLGGEGVAYLAGDYLRYEISGASEILLYPAKVGDVYHGELICLPTEDALVVDDRLYDDWVEAIVAGAKARLFVMPNKDWTNLDLVRPNEILARRGMTRANKKRAKSRTGKSLSVKPRSFFNA